MRGECGASPGPGLDWKLAARSPGPAAAAQPATLVITVQYWAQNTLTQNTLTQNTLATHNIHIKSVIKSRRELCTLLYQLLISY